MPPVPDRQLPREMRFPVAPPGVPHPPRPVVSGYCHVIDGDTIVIDGRHIRLAGIDAPELDHPWGQKSKWALVALCRGQRITAQLKPELSHDRLVAECFLPDGRDLAAELVKAGLALDWPKFSGGKYRSLEPEGARKKLWRANLRQGGMMRPADDLPPIVRSARTPYRWRSTETPAPIVHMEGKPNFWVGWMIAGGLALLLVGCSLVGGAGG